MCVGGVVCGCVGVCGCVCLCVCVEERGGGGAVLCGFTLFCDVTPCVCRAPADYRDPRYDERPRVDYRYDERLEKVVVV
jgi:hypothetical protein